MKTLAADQTHSCLYCELRLQTPHQNQRLAPCWIDRTEFQRLSHLTRSEQHSFDRRFQMECPATYKPSPNMQTRDCRTLRLRSKHLFFPLRPRLVVSHHSSRMSAAKFGSVCNRQ
jgi:hypothetical protein